MIVLTLLSHSRLCARAPVFDRMFNGGFREASDQLAKLPEDDPEAFNVFLEWLYTSRLTQPNDLQEADMFTWTWSYLKVYCFAEKYCLSELMNHAVSTLILTMSANSQLPDAEEMAYVYENSSSGSHLRRFMALCLQFEVLRLDSTGCWENDKLCELMTSCKDLTMDFLTLSRQCNSKALMEPSKMNPCDFHIHEAEDECVVKNDPTLPRWKGSSI